MAKAAQLGRQGSASPSAVSRSMRESAMWIFGALAIIMLLALFSYSPADPGFSHTGTGSGKLQNLIGAAGAWYADFSFYLFGTPAYLFPLMALFVGWFLCLNRAAIEAIEKHVVILRSVGFVIALATSCGLATLHFVHPELRETAGGVLGQLVGYGLESALGLLGATLLLLSLWLAAISLFTGMSWLSAMDWIGQQVFAGIEYLRVKSLGFREWLTARRNQQMRHQVVREKRQEEQKKLVKRVRPRIEAPPKPPEVSERAEKERQVPMFEPMASGALPPLSLLDEPPPKPPGYSEEALEGMSRLVELKLLDFGVEVQVVAVHPGPVVTRFELDPAAGVKVSQISNLAKDIARSLSAISVRVVEVIPGKSYVGLEIPNETREIVTLGEILGSRAFDEQSSPLTLALGKDISGKSVVADLGKMPHLMIAGTTGSGKSVGINAMILSLLYKSTPEQVRMIMIDPKMLELSVYEGIPHLLAPVVTDMKDAANSLRWSVVEMERRYRLMAALKVRNLAGYNRRVNAAIAEGNPIKDPLFVPEEEREPGDVPTLLPLPNIVIVIDELADMMMIVGKKVEELIARLAQKARASGIHLIVATQRPSVDVITGLIKANIPCRIAFQVSAKVDSRTILDQGGAESLLGHGDMLFLPTGAPTPVRVHGAFVSDEEVIKVSAQLKAGGQPSYIDEVTEGPSAPIPGLSGEKPAGGDDGEQDPLYDQAVQIVVETRRASISGVQRRLKVGYNRAARLVETMEAAGLVSALQSNGSREVIAPPPPKN